MNTVASTPNTFSRKGGFTLTEIMISTAVFMIGMGAAMSFFLYGTRLTSYNTGKLQINHDIRKFTSEMADNATFSNYFVVYNSFEDRTILNDARSGDFLALVYRDEDDFTLVNRIIGYYRAAAAGAEGPVMKFDIELDPPQLATAATLVNLLPATTTLGTHDQVIELSKGLSDGRLFYNFYDRSIMVRGEILHQGNIKKQATNTYNFTVSPRG